LLKTFHRTLRPLGTLIATVPAYEFLWSGEDYVSEHLRRYTRKRLTRTLRSAGFENIWCSYYNTFLFPVVLLVTLGKRLFFPREMYCSNIKPLSEWQNELLYKVFAFERHFFEPHALSPRRQPDLRRTEGLASYENRVGCCSLHAPGALI
jgi:hypothetical protein